ALVFAERDSEGAELSESSPPLVGDAVDAAAGGTLDRRFDREEVSDHVADRVDEVGLDFVEREVDHRGSPNTRSPRMFFWMSLDPPAIVAGQAPRKPLDHSSFATLSMPRISMATRTMALDSSPSNTWLTAAMSSGRSVGFAPSYPSAWMATT